MEKLKTISLNGRYVLMAFLLFIGVFFLFHLVHQPVIDWAEPYRLDLSGGFIFTYDSAASFLEL